MGSNREKSNIAIKIISHFDGSNNIFADCMLLMFEAQARKCTFSLTNYTFFIQIFFLHAFILILDIGPFPKFEICNCKYTLVEIFLSYL